MLAWGTSTPNFKLWAPQKQNGLSLNLKLSFQTNQCSISDSETGEPSGVYFNIF